MAYRTLSLLDRRSLKNLHDESLRVLENAGVRVADPECPRGDTPLFDAIRRVIKRRDPNVPVVAMMGTGGSERGLLADIGVGVYGFCPVLEEPGEPSPHSLAHGPDERLSVDNLMYGTQVLFEVVCEANGIGA